MIARALRSSTTCRCDGWPRPQSSIRAPKPIRYCLALQSHPPGLQSLGKRQPPPQNFFFVVLRRALTAGRATSLLGSVLYGKYYHPRTRFIFKYAKTPAVAVVKRCGSDGAQVGSLAAKGSLQCSCERNRFVSRGFICVLEPGLHILSPIQSSLCRTCVSMRLWCSISYSLANFFVRVQKHDAPSL